MKTQNTSTARRPQLLGKLIHQSTRTRLAENADESGQTHRSLRTSTLEMRWSAGELLIACRVSEVELAKANR